MSNKRKRLRIKYKKERAILSDVLPYELPIIFSNRHFYRFLVQYGIEIDNNSVTINNNKLSSKEAAVLPEIVKLLLGCNKDTPTKSTPFVLDIKDSDWRTPFIYKISHKEKEFRELAIIHPKNQVELINIYDKYKELILYYCSLSRYSIRKPDDIAKFVYYKDKLHRFSKGYKRDSVENYLNEYENLRTFFSYKKYTNIYRFYEDYRYQRAEKKYNHLVKFDIAKCFDSIYTHSLVWALHNKEIVKNNLGWSKNTFAGEFDKFMQNVNFGETNGILIGPEFSRIFAELIFQKIDKSVETKLLSDNQYFVGQHYECYRYVDDYFLFYNDDLVKDTIMDAFRLELKEYKMSLSEAKTVKYDKPIITDITIAKYKIVDLIGDSIKFKIEEAELPEIADNDSEKADLELINDKFTIYVNPNKLAAKFKAILKESNVGYKDVINYTLATIARKVEAIIKKIDKKFREYTELELLNRLDKDGLKKKYNLEKRFTAFVINVLDFIFFIYTVNPRVNSTIKLTVVLNTIISFFNGRQYFDIKELGGRKAVSRFEGINKDMVFKKIQDEIRLVLEKTKIVKHSQVETLYLLIILKELGREYMLPADVLTKYFCLNQDDGKTELKCKEDINALSIMVLLFYISNESKYDAVRSAVTAHIVEKISTTDKEKRRRNTELTLILFDSLSCPYINTDIKRKLLSLFEINELTIKDNIIEFCCTNQKYWFTKWGKINLNKELNAKISLEVYS